MQPDKQEQVLDARMRCAACGRIDVRVQLLRSPQEDGTQSWRFIYNGIEAGNGRGDEIGEDNAALLIAAFAEPLRYERVHTAGLYDDAGFCADCRLPYCRNHWSPSETGYGHCPQGHGKSLDPHWSPRDD